MSADSSPEMAPGQIELGFRDMLRRVRDVDPAADAGAVRRYAAEIAEADAVLQALALDPSRDPLDAAFSPEWNNGQAT